VFLDDVRLSAEAVIDEPGAGWSVAMTMLGFERMSVGSGTHSAPLDQLVRDLAAAVQAESVAERLGAVAARLLALKFQNYRLLTDLEQGRMPGPEVGLVKISAVHASLDACRLVADVLGHEALVTTDWGHQISALPALRSAGGTAEILRNVIGERVLQLPPEPKVSE
jgi:alkylation response protein AidB-like acyl-CoA dehydrogenase